MDDSIRPRLGKQMLGLGDESPLDPSRLTDRPTDASDSLHGLRPCWLSWACHTPLVGLSRSAFSTDGMLIPAVALAIYLGRCATAAIGPDKDATMGTLEIDVCPCHRRCRLTPNACCYFEVPTRRRSPCSLHPDRFGSTYRLGQTMSEGGHVGAVCS